MWYIVQRECRDLLRRPRSLWQLGLGLLVFSLVFMSSWQSMSRLPGGRSSEMGKFLFMSVAHWQLFFLLWLGRVASHGIVGEREKDTWDLLVASPVRPWSIVLGKVFASLLYMGLIYFALLPMLALCFLLGGVSPREMFGTYLILGGAGLLAASVGLACSSTIRS
ncbi:MAG TPA: ABC transporter permease, partial [bacterium]|nr:ABC transporter permease [bacterium]